MIESKDLPKAIFEPTKDLFEDLIWRASRGLNLRAGGMQPFDSPIEIALAVALQARIDTEPYVSDDFHLAVERARQTSEEVISAFTKADVEANRCWIVPQVRIANIRVDFLCLYRQEDDEIGKIVVECDGHDYHERTHEQAARDKSRDRLLQAADHQVYRFTGSEIWNAPHRCANQLMWVLMNGCMRGFSKDR